MLPPFMQRVDSINALSDDAFTQQFLPASSSDLSYTPTPSISTPVPPSYTLHLHPIASMSKSDLKTCFDLVEHTSAGDYRASTKGWKPRAKWREMAEADMRYLLVRAAPPQEVEGGERPILAFMSFMITVEDARPVVYIYEIHLADAVRRQGIGAHLMRVVEHIAVKTGMEALMLTVFRSNEGARRFYATMGFGVDGCSPRDRVLRGGKVKRCDYLIMSKGVGESPGSAQEEEWEDDAADDVDDTG
ncbi:acyl-CoA N-acyltransferase [Pseudovirgaria hyperparasitica]|uniref:N-alpha-acetyltransferase 40 n=1 Tax=Pseudovirgaria hyperparasitica TaxID=470096 RepID=A0A6A6W3A0_9PEZI|nr:acyl-CoA N-acyltransferase [Pseudovirgaria hyperparasitica]KAF2757083.1 acyl-CoA N-acyltransferase [Pseudovirgaria hyperparasitica]